MAVKLLGGTGDCTPVELSPVENGSDDRTRAIEEEERLRACLEEDEERLRAFFGLAAE